MRNLYRLHFFFKVGYIYYRIYAFNKPAQFSTKIKIKSRHWDNINNKPVTKGKDKHPQVDQISTQLDKIKTDLNQIQEDLHYRYKNHGLNYTVADLKATFEGKTATENSDTLLTLFAQHNRKMQETIGKPAGYSEGTVKNYNIRLKNVALFIQEYYKKPDFYLNAIKKQFAEDMKQYMLTPRLKDGKVVVFNMETTSRHLEAVNRVMNYAVNNEVLQRNLLQGIHIPKTNYREKEIIYLKIEELELLESCQFPSDTMQRVADCTVFAAHAGLAYKEQRILSEQHIVKGIDGNNWVSIVRFKTKRFKPLPVKIPIDSTAQRILDKYAEDPSCKLKHQKLPVHPNAIYNRVLKEIAALLGINKDLSTHSGRKSFGALLLNDGVPIAKVAATMGDSVEVIEKLYARIIECTIARDMEAYRKRKSAEL